MRIASFQEMYTMDNQIQVRVIAHSAWLMPQVTRNALGPTVRKAN